MARPKLSSPGQPFALRFVLRAVEALASLKLAVLVISAFAGVLAWATWVERSYGSAAAHYGIYGTRWFAGLVSLLGANVLVAALIRFPWRKQQTGFVVTHAGILVLLLGCLLSWMGGIDAQMPIFEETVAHRAFVQSQHFELTVYGSPSSAAERAESTGEVSPAAAPREQADRFAMDIPFVAGPFNWRDYRRLPWLPWQLTRHDQGTVYNHDGIRLEVLDYLSDSKTVPVPPLKLQVSGRATKLGSPPAAGNKPAAPPVAVGSGLNDRPLPTGGARIAQTGGGTWQTVELNVQDAAAGGSQRRRMGLSGRQELPGGQQIVFWVAGSRAETDAFLNSRPDGPLGTKGQLVLWAGGKSHTFLVDSLAPGSRVPLGDTGLQLELAQSDPQFSGVAIRLFAPGESLRRLILLADYPELNQQDEEHGVFGSYWLGPRPAPPATAGSPAAGLRGIGRPRIDILQGVDGKLYSRVWKSPHVEAIGEVAADGTHQVSFAATEDQVTWYVDEFIPQDRPGARIEPVAFSAKKGSNQKVRRALVRLTVDDRSEEFWLDGLEASQFEHPPRQTQRRVVCGRGRRAAVSLARDEIDSGFRVRLERFNRKLDPGTSMASHYSSLVDFLAPELGGGDPAKRGSDDAQVLRRNVLITLNDPANFSDPRSGRSYRIFQESFAGPWRPGDEEFDQLVPAGSKKDQLFISYLTLNYDPGRGLKYTGSLLVVAGVATMFFMRAYFFRRRTRS
jgi:hypothetical protein